MHVINGEEVSHIYWQALSDKDLNDSCITTVKWWNVVTVTKAICHEHLSIDACCCYPVREESYSICMLVSSAHSDVDPSDDYTSRSDVFGAATTMRLAASTILSFNHSSSTMMDLSASSPFLLYSCHPSITTTQIITLCCTWSHHILQIRSARSRHVRQTLLSNFSHCAVQTTCRCSRGTAPGGGATFSCSNASVGFSWWGRTSVLGQLCRRNLLCGCGRLLWALCISWHITRLVFIGCDVGRECGVIFIYSVEILLSQKQCCLLDYQASLTCSVPAYVLASQRKDKVSVDVDLLRPRTRVYVCCVYNYLQPMSK